MCQSIPAASIPGAKSVHLIHDESRKAVYRASKHLPGGGCSRLELTRTAAIEHINERVCVCVCVCVFVSVVLEIFLIFLLVHLILPALSIFAGKTLYSGKIAASHEE